MNAIVYTSNTGSTARYAEWLAHETGLPVYPAQKAKKELPAHSEILYLGWIMAGNIKGYANAARRYKICAVCGVGMGRTGTQIHELRIKNHISDEMPLFTLQGDFHLEKLHGIYKLMMQIMTQTAGKALAAKSDRTPDEEDMLDMIRCSGERICPDHLKAVLDWYNEQK